MPRGERKKLSELIEGRASFSFQQLQIEPGVGKGHGPPGRGPNPAARALAALTARCHEGETINPPLYSTFMYFKL